jgi:hypothetical protein
MEDTRPAEDSVSGLALRRAALARQVRRRAQADMALLAGLTGGAALLGATTHEAILAGTAALSLGLLGYVVRRDRDLVALARAARWRESAVEGRGLPLSAWRAGAPLGAWAARRDAAVDKQA